MANSLLDDAKAAFATITQTAQQGVDVYSSFLDAKANYTLAQAQKISAQNEPQYSAESRDVMSGGVNYTFIIAGVAAIGIGILLYKRLS